MRHKSNRSRISPLIRRRADTWRFNDDVIDHTACHQKVGQENQTKHGHGRGSVDPRRLFDLQILRIKQGKVCGFQDGLH